MKAVKWLYVDWNIPFRLISEEMLSYQFSKERNDGFILSRNVRDTIEGKFIQKIIIKDKIQDPYGEIISSNRINYNIVSFILSKKHDFPSIELNNPPRLLRPFLNKITEFSNLDMTVTDIHTDPIKWLGYLEKKIGSTKVNYIECSGINVANKGTAKVIFRSAQDIRNGIPDILGKKKYIIDRIRCSFITPKYKGNVELSKNGSIKITENCEKFMLPLLRKSIGYASDTK